MDISTESLNTLIKSLKDSGFFNTKNLCDKHYSIRELYNHRMVLFNILCQTYYHLAWKSKKHYEDEIFNDTFIAGINTKKGPATFHFKMEYFENFNIPEIEKAPKYDGYSTDDVLNRLKSLPILDNSYINTKKSINYNQDLSKNLNNKDIQKLTKKMNDILIILRKINILDLNEISDSNHSFKELYKQKRILFNLICKNYKDLAWKSKSYKNGKKLPENKFMVCLNTPLGNVCYIFNKERYKDFDVKIILCASLTKDEIYKDVLKKLSSLEIKQKKLYNMSLKE